MAVVVVVVVVGAVLLKVVKSRRRFPSHNQEQHKTSSFEISGPKFHTHFFYGYFIRSFVESRQHCWVNSNTIFGISLCMFYNLVSLVSNTFLSTHFSINLNVLHFSCFKHKLLYNIFLFTSWNHLLH